MKFVSIPFTNLFQNFHGSADTREP